jgi:hypothetical protein
MSSTSCSSFLSSVPEARPSIKELFVVHAGLSNSQKGGEKEEFFL